MNKVFSIQSVMDTKRAQEIIRRLAETSKCIGFTQHAEERMEERDISLADVLRVLKNGHIMQPPVRGKSQHEWKCKIVRHARGNRHIGVVTVIIREQKLLILTVEWEDL